MISLAISTKRGSCTSVASVPNFSTSSAGFCTTSRLNGMSKPLVFIAAQRVWNVRTNRTIYIDYKDTFWEGFGGRTLIPQVPIQHPTLNTQVPASRHSKNIALRSDVLLFNSSIEGFASFREGNSSWFIDALVSNMEMYGEELTITNVLTKVNNDVTKKEGALMNTNVTKCKQTPVGYNTLKYELKLKKIV
ncbi:hypothetical protein AVEN_165161-1 [Araneus ventricosus]|uniref:Caspase family p10 domain-containing protein n=1 Tax=Araneus ventricosus TaxID=182803 RepID=A0A4Y2B828_ARAVE|nr:hypothetical protein AVEN_165161-1 [Araneus ventricosus]